MLRKKRVMFGEHLDLASYKDGQRYTLNPPGRAYRSVVWDHYNIRYRLALLQEYFGCFVGANVYLTPPGTQGFAPHYDDIEAFIMQLEGSKNWRVYAPRTPSEKLPRESSPNFTQEELGKPVMTVTLKPGDLLYLPRGFIHQGTTPDDTHSLHLTISTYQKHTWGDFLTKLLPIALRSAMETDVEFRRGLPVGFLRHVGGFTAVPDTPSMKKNKEASKCEDELRRGVVQRLRQLADRIEHGSRSEKRVLENADDLETESPDPLLVAADHMAGSDAPTPSGVIDVVELEPDTEIRLVRWSAVRALRTRISSESSVDNEDDSDADVSEASSTKRGKAKDDKTNLVVAMYHSLDNTDVYKERELEELALDIKMDAAISLYEAGLVVTRYPLPPTDDGDTSDEEEDDEASDESMVDSDQLNSESDDEQ
ncbi:unnamed protein product, partial [Echinostoma caproni]|uniref:Bifunctional lysine-specific demethylase and histidyl-hydroxylase n=1 Tax=Echinostoma caproni TaxID=27848 RepID=A0A183AU52_9TREM